MAAPSQTPIGGEEKCVLCDTRMDNHQSASRGQPMHRECALREVAGGIGHLLDHEHFCITLHDPDAGLSYRASALLVWTLNGAYGPEWVSKRTVVPEPPTDKMKVMPQDAARYEEWP